MAARAELIADGGAAAEGSELFRSRGFHRAEGVTHTLRIEAARGSARVALIVRDIPGSARLDATSPYGYPGGEVEGEPPAASEVDWEPTGLVSIFARERLVGPSWLAGPRSRSRVLVHDPARPAAVRRRLAEQIRANERRGWTIEVRRGSEAGANERAAFARAYAETMRRAGAAGRYFFDDAYFAAVLGFEQAWLLQARAPAGELAAGAIAGVSDGILHYFLGGTGDKHLAASPFKNVVAALLALAEELALPLNLGGGVEPGDGLESFKRGFANAEEAFRVHELVCDEREYERLAAGRAGAGFFPAYRG